MDRLEYIDSFFKQELAANEKQEFEQKILEDPTFAADVAFYCRSMQAISEHNTAEKKQRFRELYYGTPGVETSAQPKSPVVRLFARYVAAAAVVAALIIGWYFFNTPDSPPQLADKFLKTEMNDLGGTMGNAEDSLHAGIELYKTGNYQRALTFFDQISARDPRLIEAKKLKGIVYLQSKNYDKALDVFTQLENQQGILSNPGKFYHAVTLMKRNGPGDIEEAKRLLRDVVEEDLDEKETARKWLEQIQ